MKICYECDIYYYIYVESYYFYFFDCRLQGVVQKIYDHMEDLKFESEDLYSSEGAER